MRAERRPNSVCGSGLARDWSLRIRRVARKTGLRTRREPIHGGSAAAVLAADGPQTRLPGRAPPLIATPGPGPDPRAGSAPFDSETCGGGPAVALWMSSAGADAPANPPTRADQACDGSVAARPSALEPVADSRPPVQRHKRTAPSEQRDRGSLRCEGIREGCGSAAEREGGSRPRARRQRGSIVTKPSHS